MDNIARVKVSFIATIDRDIYPLPVSDDYSDEVEEAVTDALYELDGWTIKKISVRTD